MRNIDELIGRIRETVQTHRLENEGEYCRWLWQNETKPRRLGLNEYGCADAANILYTINDFIEEPEKRAGWIRTLRSLQDKETGMYYEETHHEIHTTAHCIAALELFDAKVLHPLTALKDYTTPGDKEVFGWSGHGSRTLACVSSGRGNLCSAQVVGFCGLSMGASIFRLVL